MSKELLHTDGLADFTEPEPIIPVPNPEDRQNIVYRSLDKGYQLEARLAQLMRALLFIAMLSLGLLMAAQVFMRYVISLPFLGIEEMAPMLAVWIYFIGMAYCSRERDHIEGGVLSLLVKRRTPILAIRLIGSIICLVAVIVFTKYAIDFTQFNISLNRKSTYMRLPKYLWDISMVSGFMLMALYLCLQVFLEFRALITGKGAD